MPDEDRLRPPSRATLGARLAREGAFVEERRADARVVMTYQDYLELPNDGKRYEILGGDPHMTPSPRRLHQDALSNLNDPLKAFVRARGLGWVGVAPFDVVLDERNVVQPDLIYVSKARFDILADDRVAGPPDLVVEVLSPSTAKLDRTLKLRAYEEHGVAHYWILDPERQLLEERVLVEKAYRLVATLSGSAVFRPQLFPELAIELGNVWKVWYGIGD